MKYGINLLLWTAEMHEGLMPVLEWLHEIGYDGVELPLFNTDLDYAAWGKRLDGLDLQRTAVTVRNAEDNPISSNPAVRTAGVEANRRAIDCCAAAGATHLSGPFYAAHGEFSGAGPTTDEWAWGVDSMRQVAEHAAAAGVVLGVEPLNRFETYLLNTHADAARFVGEVGHPNCRMMYDTFHSHIEEKGAADAIRACGDHLCHVHISENDRSTPGLGSVNWEATFDTLHDVGYEDWMTIEAFGLAMPEVASATKIWRKMYDSEKQLARDGLAFMRAEVSKRWP